MRGIANIEIQKGGGWQRVFAFAANGAPLDLSTYTTAVLTMTPLAGTPVTLSIANGKLANGGTNGLLTATLAKTDVDAIDWTKQASFTLTLTPTSTSAEALEVHGPVAFFGS